MILAKKIDYSKIINHHFLLYGETNTGKTYFTANFVKYLLESENVNPKSITILEFGPKFKTVNKVKIGGHIQDFYSKSLFCVNRSGDHRSYLALTPSGNRRISDLCRCCSRRQPECLSLTM